MPRVQSIPLAIKALAASGMKPLQIAAQLGVNRATVWRHRHDDLLDPALIQHASKTIADKMLLGATAAMDTFLDKAEEGQLNLCSPSALIKMSATALEASQAYAMACGANSFLKDTLSNYGVEQSHSVSRVTMEQRLTVEAAGVSTTTCSQTMPKK
jgi:hypothetical protein